MTLVFMSEDIGDQLADSPNSITAVPPGATLPFTAPCELRESDELKLASPSSAPSIMRLVRVYVETALFGFLVGGYHCIVDGIEYTVWERLEEASGLTQLLLQVDQTSPDLTVNGAPSGAGFLAVNGANGDTSGAFSVNGAP